MELTGLGCRERDAHCSARASSFSGSARRASLTSSCTSTPASRSVAAYRLSVVSARAGGDDRGRRGAGDLGRRRTGIGEFRAHEHLSAHDWPAAFACVDREPSRQRRAPELTADDELLGIGAELAGVLGGPAERRHFIPGGAAALARVRARAPLRRRPR